MLFLDRYLIGVLKCHQTRKKRYSRLAIIHCTVPIAIVAPVVIGSGNYVRKKKDTVVCLAGCAVVSVFGSGGKLAGFLLWREIFITTGKKDTVVCLAGARSLLRPEKKRYSRLSVGCAVLAITVGGYIIA